MPLIIPPEAWRPTTPIVTSKPGARTPQLLDSVLRQFSVETNPRYTPRGSTTFCNIYAGDVINAMGVPNPHWIDAATGTPVDMGKGIETNANKLYDWFLTHGPTYGWASADMANAVANAKMGALAIAVWKNPSGASGHIAVFTPASTLQAPMIAQAGAQNFVNRPLAAGFGNLPVKLYTHP